MYGKSDVSSDWLGPLPFLFLCRFGPWPLGALSFDLSHLCGGLMLPYLSNQSPHGLQSCSTSKRLLCFSNSNRVFLKILYEGSASADSGWMISYPVMPPSSSVPVTSM